MKAYVGEGARNSTHIGRAASLQRRRRHVLGIFDEQAVYQPVLLEQLLVPGRHSSGAVRYARLLRRRPPLERRLAHLPQHVRQTPGPIRAARASVEWQGPTRSHIGRGIAWSSPIRHYRSFPMEETNATTSCRHALKHAGNYFALHAFQRMVELIRFPGRVRKDYATSEFSSQASNDVGGS